MSVALPAVPAARPVRLDLSWPILILFAALLCVMILLPLSWLVYYAFVDRNGAFTLSNFTELVTDPIFLDPLITTIIIATSSSIICCVVAAPIGWLVARTDMPLRRTVRILVTASFVTPPFLGAIAWELLAAPNSGLLNQLFRELDRRAAGRASVQHLQLRPGSSSSSPATRSLTSSCWSPMRSTARPAISRTPPPSSAAAPG